MFIIVESEHVVNWWIGECEMPGEQVAEDHTAALYQCASALFRHTWAIIIINYITNLITIIDNNEQNKIPSIINTGQVQYHINTY